MNIPSFKEDHSSQIPALQLLQKLGYTYLAPEEALTLRSDRTSNVILEPILRKQLKAINSIQVSTSKTAIFSDANIENGIMALKDMPMNEGFIATSKKAFELLTYGKALEQSIDGDKKSFTLQYIDWNNFENNVFHVTEEFNVMRFGTSDCYRPDIVLFVNGIPLCVMECKRPDIKNPIGEAISQHIRNQQEDGIRNLYVYSQLLLSLSVSQAKYATTDTKEEFWASWKETEGYDKSVVQQLVNQPLTGAQKQKLFVCRNDWERKVIEAREQEELEVSTQDEYLYWLAVLNGYCNWCRILFCLKAGHLKKLPDTSSILRSIKL